ncbi:MAG: hypothetical protein COX02_00730 [Candidatus Vogelbacteria bacterium CG22_combo_CG10-13_8_21_14_all_37_9]|uniref:Uncharacterized protein n=1 Tax=Candidatus Vogelbacteria bacterium CG22_combo_CG10-13_8_21_14_all_37_9 TaxID=1975046 RepID=A0A2H0BL11_9BACT|nr:MAG: hypothetical protein BK005_02345 [bacterium CG10_37_50]PIP58367.1 MAG: hypothetical protein COX02_00730 [Candidatus Vogelbacteria bacterium CG22_combo_CG10-13_8_21_14_all_37_9]
MALNNKTIHLESTRSAGALPFLVSLLVFSLAFYLGGGFGKFFAPIFSPLGEMALQADQLVATDLNIFSRPAPDLVKETQEPLKTILPTKLSIDPVRQDWSDQITGFKYALISFGDFLWQSSANWLSTKLDQGANSLVHFWDQKFVKDKILTETFPVKVLNSNVNILSVSEAKIRIWNESLNQVGTKLNLTLGTQIQKIIDPILAGGNNLNQTTLTLGKTLNISGHKIILTQIEETKSEFGFVNQKIHQSVLVFNRILLKPIQATVLALTSLPQVIAGQVAGFSDQFLALGTKQFSRALAFSDQSVQFSTEKFSSTITWPQKIKLTTQERINGGWSEIAIWTRAIEANSQLGWNYSLTKVQTLASVRLANLSLSVPEWQAFILDRWWGFKTGLATWFNNTLDLASSNWRYFLGLKADKQVASVPSALATTTSLVEVEALKEKIKTEVRTELKQELSQIIKQNTNNNISASGQSGLIVAPSTGNAKDDEELKANIEAMFSDRVTVQFDSNRKAGVVSPVFAPPGSDNYIFLLAPVKK